MATTMTGTVTKVGKNSFEIDGTRWVTISMYAQNHELPPVGRVVTVDIDERGFTKGHTTVPQSTSVATNEVAPQQQSPSHGYATGDAALATRLEILKLAREIAQPSTDLQAILKVASQLETWLLR